ncbi:hypothetical protein [Acidithiobacillus ferrooxidans]|jgi:hypothetical protein|uniref:hypothetical protein n=1 Tax=Acidithiobacillus ferrooxidans TaxID=920 RepID=UPI0013D5DC03|nr:hypothetical protein [Acidithiobacillus ferrooxidans]
MQQKTQWLIAKAWPKEVNACAKDILIEAVDRFAEILPNVVVPRTISTDAASLARLVHLLKAVHADLRGGKTVCDQEQSC